MMLLRRYNDYPSSISTLLTGMRKPVQVGLIFPSAKVSPNTQIELRQTGEKIKVGGKMDVWSLKEMLLDKFYECFGFAVLDGWMVANIVGGIGEYTIFATSDHLGYLRAQRIGGGQPA